MRITVGSQLHIQDPTAEVVQWCKDHLILPNPDYAKKLRMGFWLGDTPAKLYLFERNGNKLVTPYGTLRNVLELCDSNLELTVDITDGDTVDYQCQVPLYDYQREALKGLIEGYYGILQSPAGSGKTQIGIALAAELGCKTLWLTHTKDLLTQSRNRAALYMDESLLGTITEGMVNIGSGITFATVQTMCNLNLSLYRDVWDCIIVDECHRAAGTPTAVTQFSKVLNSLAARHKYGLSATVHRSDGMIEATYALLGKIVYSVPEAAVAEKIMQVSILPRQTPTRESTEFLGTDGMIVYAKLINYLTCQAERNNLIAHDLTANAEHSNLILSDRLDHLRTLIDLLPPLCKSKAVMVDGSMTSKVGKAAREKAIEDMRSGRKSYLFATYALAKEGLDIPRLDRLYLTSPQKDYAVVTQSIGRIARVFPGKSEPVVYDYVDPIKYLYKTFKKRCTSYKKAGCKFKEE